MMTSTHTPQMGYSPVGARLVAVGGVSVGSWRRGMPISATNCGFSPSAIAPRTPPSAPPGTSG